MKIKQQIAIGHNLDASDLMFADKIGGLVCPSMAAFRTDHLFRNFGEITLLMDRNKINLRTDPTYNADVYTTRFPSCYYKVNNGVLDRFAEKVADTVPEFSALHSKVDYHENAMVSKGFEHVADEYMRDPKVLLAFARDNGLNPRIYRSTHESGVTFIDNMDKPKAFVRELKRLGVKNIKQGTPEYDDYSKKMYEAMDAGMQRIAESKGGTPEEIAEDKAYFKERLGKSYFKEENGKPQLFFNPHQKILDYITKLERDPNPIDTVKTRERLEKLVQTDKQKQAFRSWLGEHIAPAFHSPHMHVVTRGGHQKKLAFTAENALKAMKGKVNGEEKTIFMGAGSIRSLVAKRFTSYRAMESSMDELVSEDEMRAIGEKFNSRLADLPEKMAPFYKYQTDSWRYRDAVYEEIADYARTGSVRTLESFDEIDPDVLKELDDFLSELKHGKTHYFEIKKQSIVKLDEFDAAIVPRGVDKGALKILKEADIKVSYYEPEQNLSRQLAISKQKDLLFGEGQEVTLTTSKPDNEFTP